MDDCWDDGCSICRSSSSEALKEKSRRSPIAVHIALLHFQGVNSAMQARCNALLLPTDAAAVRARRELAGLIEADYPKIMVATDQSAVQARRLLQKRLAKERSEGG